MWQREEGEREGGLYQRIDFLSFFIFFIFLIPSNGITRLFAGGRPSIWFIQIAGRNQFLRWRAADSPNNGEMIRWLFTLITRTELGNVSFLPFRARDEFSSASIKPYCSVERKGNLSFFLSMPLCGLFTFVNIENCFWSCLNQCVCWYRSGWISWNYSI